MARKPTPAMIAMERVRRAAPMWECVDCFARKKPVVIFGVSSPVVRYCLPDGWGIKRGHAVCVKCARHKGDRRE